MDSDSPVLKLYFVIIQEWLKFFSIPQSVVFSSQFTKNIVKSILQ